MVFPLGPTTGQHGSPDPPQATHAPPASPVWQRVPGSWQRPPQQGWPRPPQPAQRPSRQVSSAPPAVPQLSPAAMHIPAAQHPPSWQRVPPQQALPGVPQGSQAGPKNVMIRHSRFGPRQVKSSQQLPPAVSHDRQAPSRQPVPGAVQ
jgi:hypothetical protein